MRRSELGFSLLESLLVLALLSICLVCLRFTQPIDFKQSIEGRLLFETIAQELQTAQQTAILQKVDIRVDFDAYRQEVRFTEMRTPRESYQLRVPEPWQIEHSYAFTFRRDARTTNFKSIHFINMQDNTRVSFVFQIANGRFCIERG